MSKLELECLFLVGFSKNKRDYQRVTEKSNNLMSAQYANVIFLGGIKSWAMKRRFTRTMIC